MAAPDVGLVLGRAGVDPTPGVPVDTGTKLLEDSTFVVDTELLELPALEVGAVLVEAGVEAVFPVAELEEVAAGCGVEVVPITMAVLLLPRQAAVVKETDKP